ncbi:MAG: phosphatase PAP2 family protein [Myxococcaceae bacterium]
MRAALMVLTALWLSATVQAEEPAGQPPSPRSVYQLDLAWDIPVSAVAAAGLIVPEVLTDSIIHPSCPCDASSVPSFDRWAIGYSSSAADTVSTVTAGLAIVAPLVLDLADVGATTEFLEDTAILAETLLVNGALANLAKYTAQRPIPLVYSPADPSVVSSPADYRSFYSGHTSTTFAALTAMSMTWTLRHGATWWPWVVTVVVGTSVGLERIFAGRHFPTDVLMGAAAGTLVGLAVPWLHSRARIGPGRVQLAPVDGGAMLTWGGRF